MGACGSNEDGGIGREAQLVQSFGVVGAREPIVREAGRVDERKGTGGGTTSRWSGLDNGGMQVGECGAACKLHNNVTAVQQLGLDACCGCCCCGCC